MCGASTHRSQITQRTMAASMPCFLYNFQPLAQTSCSMSSSAPFVFLPCSFLFFFLRFLCVSFYLPVNPPPPRSSHSLIFSFSSHASYLLPTFSMQTSKFFEAVVKQKQSSQQHKHTETQNTERNDASTGWQTPARHTQSRWARICALGQHHPHPQRHNPCRRGRRSAR